MCQVAILWFLLTNSATPAPTWCWVCWWIILVTWSISSIVNLIKLGMELK